MSEQTKKQHNKPTHRKLSMTDVESSQIASIGYDAGNAIMHIQFPDGALYEYQNISPKEHKELMSAKSVGSHFIRNIKSQPGKFPFKKLS